MADIPLVPRYANTQRPVASNRAANCVAILLFSLRTSSYSEYSC